MSYSYLHPHTTTPVLHRYRGPNINADAAAKLDMTTTSDAGANEIDRQGIHTAEGNHGNEEKEGRYVVWARSGSLSHDMVRPGDVLPDILALSRHAQENHPSAHSGLTYGTSAARIPELAHQSRHLTRAGDRSSPASHFDMNRAQSHQDVPVGPNRQHAYGRNRRQALQRVYDKPGKKPAVNYEPNLLRLQELSRWRGGQDFAITWLAKVFTNGVTPDALTRTLSAEEVDAADYDHGFQLTQAYDGLLEQVGDRFGCGLCPEETRSNWKNKKDSLRHLKKFHFGIGENCGTW